MAADDFSKFLDDTLELPGVPSKTYPDGHTYRVESPDFTTGLRLTSFVSIGMQVASGLDVDPKDAARLKLNDAEERDFHEQVLGAVYQKMQDDGVSWVRVRRLAEYALMYFTLGEDAAEKVLSRGAEGNAPNRAERRASQKASSATATSSRPPVSTGSTTSPRKFSSKRKPA